MKANSQTFEWMCDDCNIDLQFDIKTRLYKCPKCSKYYEICPIITDDKITIKERKFIKIIVIL